MVDKNGFALNPANNRLAVVSPVNIVYVTPDNHTPAQTFATFMVTARSVGRATIFVDWHVDPADTGPNCTSTIVIGPTVTLQVAPNPTSNLLAQLEPPQQALWP